MTMGLTRAARISSLRSLFTGTNYVALLTTLPTAYDGSGLVEAAGGSYARTVLPAWSDFQSGSGPDISGLQSSVDTAFPQLTGALGPVVGFGIFNSGSGGTLICWGALVDGASNPITRTFASGDIPRFPAGTLQLALAESFT
jgi:hypothetical protein